MLFLSTSLSPLELPHEGVGFTAPDFFLSAKQQDSKVLVCKVILRL